MRFRSSYSCGAAEDFPPHSARHLILDWTFAVLDLIQKRKSEIQSGGGTERWRVTSFPYIRLRLMISLDLPPSFLSSMGIGKTKIDGNTDPAFHNFLTIAGWDEAPSLDRFLGSTI